MSLLRTIGDRVVPAPPIDIRGQDIELTDALRAHAQRRLRFVLGRFGQRIARVTMHLADLKGPRGEGARTAQPDFVELGHG